ncbi:hypothetical protein E8E11_000006, partial [Didymella keratinophila]
MLALVQATMKERLIPSVVASSRDTTVLEAFVTETGSSSSFRYGTFDCAVLSLKCVRRDGQEIMVKLHDGDAVEKLLEDVLITLLEIALIPAGKYVEITYWPVDSLSTAYLRIMPKGHESWVNHISALYDSTDFMDSVMFDQSSGIVVVGKITSENSAGSENITVEMPSSVSIQNDEIDIRKDASKRLFSGGSKKRRQPLNRTLAEKEIED